MDSQNYLQGPKSLSPFSAGMDSRCIAIRVMVNLMQTIADKLLPPAEAAVELHTLEEEVLSPPIVNKSNTDSEDREVLSSVGESPAVTTITLQQVCAKSSNAGKGQVNFEWCSKIMSSHRFSNGVGG